MPVETLRVNLGNRGYDVAVTDGDLAGVGAFARQRAAGLQALVVTDVNVQTHAEAVAQALGQSRFTVTSVARPSGEGQKSLAVAGELYDRLVDMHADRQTLVVAVGGGVIGDLAGFVAATFNRGLPLLMVPTTLLATVDSSVGGKVAVNHPRGKNLIGAFHQPLGVWIDTATLATLPQREFRAGLAEVVKYGVILDADFFAFLEGNAARILARDPVTIRQIIVRCCRLKADIVEQDELEETGLRAVLNYGHTFAHAFEILAGYGTWLHGEAVAAGMVCASRLAELRGLIAPDVTQRQIALLAALCLPTTPDRWPAQELLAVMRSDKKAAAGRLRFVLPLRIGAVAVFDDIPEGDVAKVLQAG